MIDGVLYVVGQLGIALQQANQQLAELQQRIAELEAALAAKPEGVVSDG